MYIYRNTRTGVEISTLCPVGGEWELVTNTDEAVVAEAAEEPKPKPKRKRTVKK
jgi:hypothetical protein